MLSMVKKLKSILSNQIQLIVLVVLSVVALYMYLANVTGFLNVIKALLPILIIIDAVWLLYIKKKVLAAYVILFLMVYMNGAHQFVRWLFSYHFFLKEFSIDFSLNMILGLIGSLYLFVMILSYVINDGYKITFKKPSNLLLILLFALYFYLRNGFGSLIIITTYTLIALNEDMELVAIELLLCSVIVIPFTIIGRFIDDVAEFTTIHDWLMDAFGISLIVLSILAAIPLVKELFIKKPNDEKKVVDA